MNDNDFVRKEIFDETVKRLDEKYSLMFESMRDRIADIQQGVKDVREAIIRGWIIVGVIAALAAFAVTAIQFYFSVRGNG